MNIDAEGIYYRELNERVRAAVQAGERRFVLRNVRGQRYIGAGLDDGVRIEVHGVPGNDLAVFMNGAEVVVHGNAQDGVGNTMNGGKVVIHSDAGDILGYAMRGGKVFVRGNVGYRAGIHMKAYRERFPVVVVGGHTGDYLGEYMAGGMMVVLGQGCDGASPVKGWTGTGMHGGICYIRGPVEPHQAGREVGIEPLDEQDWAALAPPLGEYCADFALDPAQFRAEQFCRLRPVTTRPYGALYAY